MKHRPKDWEVVITWRSGRVERRPDMTRRAARATASGLTTTYARGMTARSRGGLFHAPTYGPAPAHAMAQTMSDA